MKKEKIGETGRYYFKADIIRYESDDPEIIKEIWRKSQPPTFNERIEQIDKWAKSILSDAGLPDSPIVAKPNNQGGWRLDYYVEKIKGKDSQSVEGLASRIVSVIATMKANAPTVADGFELGALSEQLQASRWWDSGREKGRVDALSKAIVKTMQAFAIRNGRVPKTIELWEALPVDGKPIQEREDDCIYWRRANGKEEKTTFKAFQNRLTNIRKKYHHAKK